MKIVLIVRAGSTALLDGRLRSVRVVVCWLVLGVAVMVLMLRLRLCGFYVQKSIVIVSVSEVRLKVPLVSFYRSRLSSSSGGIRIRVIDSYGVMLFRWLMSCAYVGS